jgi:hypothetical protein
VRKEDGREWSVVKDLEGDSCGFFQGAILYMLVVNEQGKAT